MKENNNKFSFNFGNTLKIIYFHIIIIIQQNYLDQNFKTLFLKQVTKTTKFLMFGEVNLKVTINQKYNIEILHSRILRTNKYLKKMFILNIEIHI